MRFPAVEFELVYLLQLEMVCGRTDYQVFCRLYFHGCISILDSEYTLWRWEPNPYRIFPSLAPASIARLVSCLYPSLRHGPWLLLSCSRNCRSWYLTSAVVAPILRVLHQEGLHLAKYLGLLLVRKINVLGIIILRRSSQASTSSPHLRVSK